MENHFFPLDQPVMPTWHTLSASDTYFPTPAAQCFSIIGNLGNDCSSGEISPPENRWVNGNTRASPSRHSNSIRIPPLGSNLASIRGDGSTRLSHLGSTLIAGGKLDGDSNSCPIAEIGNLESSSGSGDQHGNGRKRKFQPHAKCKQIPRPSSSAMVVDNGNKTEENLEEGDSDEITKQNFNMRNEDPPEPSKDYIHVRARRGQATDTHSLAERVRRVKIGERMKLLQDLVPGCNKVTGKALMLEEIINYVQSLQRQVEFLSMKVACVNPRLDHPLPKDTYQSSWCMQTQPAYPLDLDGIASSGVDPDYQTQDLQLPTLDVPNNGVPRSCEGDLHTIVEMGFGQRTAKLLQDDNTFQPQFYCRDQIKYDPQ